MKRFKTPPLFFLISFTAGSYIADLTMDAGGVLVLETASIVYNRDHGVKLEASCMFCVTLEDSEYNTYVQ
jgi:hypothetical protein